MRKVLAWLGVATLSTLVSVRAEADDVLKPYVVLILDTSGSMLIPTQSGPTSCGKKDTRLNHAVCAINSIVNSYGDMVFSLARFRETANGAGTPGLQQCDGNDDQYGNVLDTNPNPSGGDVCNTQSARCDDCNPSTGGYRACLQEGDCESDDCNQVAETGAECSDALDNDGDGRVNDGCPVSGTAETGANCLNATNDDPGNDSLINDGCPAAGFCTGQFSCTESDRYFEVLSALADGNNAVSAEFTDGTCNSCFTSTAGTLNPEIWGVGNKTFTPLAATLRGAKKYWQGFVSASDGSRYWTPGLCAGGSNAGAQCASNTDCPGGTCSTTNTGFDPINRDPAAAVFLSGNDNAQCNPIPSGSPGGCTAFVPESVCSGNADNDNDGRVNDGCVAVGAPETGTQCTDTVDSDGDGVVNDGCPAWCSGANCCCASQCRPYVTILLTDGKETCTQGSNTLAATSSLLSTTPLPDTTSISMISRASNVVTVTTAMSPPVPHPFKVGDRVIVNVPNDTTFDGVFIVTSATTTTFTYAQTAANAMVSGNGTVRHTASRNLYRVETKPIGFGIAPGDPDIEAIAHAGGAPDLPGLNEGYYAQNEAELQLAISQILADSVRAELCNGRDDDCDTEIDEDFPNKGGTCSRGVGTCFATGTLVCRADGTGLECNAPIIPPGTEGPNCDGLDNDCDGLVDDGLTCNTCVPQADTCNSADQDCDGVADQSCRCTGGASAGAACNPNTANSCPGGTCNCTKPTRPCGTGVCQGTETCESRCQGGSNANAICSLNSQCPGGSCQPTGVFQGCTAQPAIAEQCDGEDDDCDGQCDGFQIGCSQQNGACDPNSNTSCPPEDSLGSPAHYQSPDTGETACNDDVDDDKDGFVNDGCPAVNAAETNCTNDMDDDGDTFVNDGCPVPALPIQQNACRPGERSCALGCDQVNTPKPFSICSGEILPCGPDAAPGMGCDNSCNNVDEDCDNAIDEDYQPQDCSTDCGQGQTQCVNGAIICDSVPATIDDDCDGIDDDCNGVADEDWRCPDVNPADGVCDPCSIDSMGNAVCMGEPQCINGMVQCVGGPVNNETCNCLDDDCDSVIDDGNLCPAGSSCTSCQCAFTCAEGEFPCPLGKKCDSSTVVGSPETGSFCAGVFPPVACTTSNEVSVCGAQGLCREACVDSIDSDQDGTQDDGCNYCVNDPCFNVACPPVMGNLQTCVPKQGFPNEPQCVDICSLVNDGDTMAYPPCATGFVCFGPAGECRPDNCTTFPDRCASNETCVNGTCVSNPCAGVTCTQGQYCVGGDCVPSCSDVTCPTGQRCRLGACEADPCDGPCPFGQACNDTTGTCINDPCKGRTCFDGQWCNPNSGQCEEDPCETSQITCPNTTDVCRGGTCVDEDTLRPDAAGEVNVTVGGGGGCSTTGGGSGLLLALGLLFIGRRRRARSVGGAL